MSLDTLERLIGMGFSPYLALIIVFLLATCGTMAGGFAFFWKQIARERRRNEAILEERDKERAEDRADVDRRLKDCETDREDLRRNVTELDRKVTRLASCPRRDCPMRLP